MCFPSRNKPCAADHITHTDQVVGGSKSLYHMTWTGVGGMPRRRCWSNKDITMVVTDRIPSLQNHCHPRLPHLTEPFTSSPAASACDNPHRPPTLHPFAPNNHSESSLANGETRRNSSGVRCSHLQNYLLHQQHHMASGSPCLYISPGKRQAAVPWVVQARERGQIVV